MFWDVFFSFPRIFCERNANEAIILEEVVNSESCVEDVSSAKINLLLAFKSPLWLL